MATRSNDEVANLCLNHAWSEDIDDRSRFLLEMAARRINRLGKRCLRLSRRLEIAEALKEEGRGCNEKPHWLACLSFAACGMLACLSLRLQSAWDLVCGQLKMSAKNLSGVIRRLT